MLKLYTDKSEISIPKDWVAFFLPPDPDVINLYELEKKRIENGPVTPREIDFKEKILKEELEKSKTEDIMEDDIEPSGIVVSFVITPLIYVELITRWLLSQGNTDAEFKEEYSSELLESLFGDINEEIINNINNNENNIEDDDEDLGFGNRWRDWSADIDDYLDD